MIIQEEFEHIRNFGIKNGFKVTATKSIYVGVEPTYRPTADGYRIDMDNYIYGPSIEFEW